MPRAVRTVLHALSYGGIEVEASRKLADLKKMDPMRIFYRTLDAEVYNGDYKVPIRLFFPTEEDMENGAASGKKPPVILFFHGGGWVTESVENYQRVCARMAQSTGQIVASVEYRLAPEYRFPTALLDCYAAASALYAGKILPVNPELITIMGDSAGGNLAAAVAECRWEDIAVPWTNHLDSFLYFPLLIRASLGFSAFSGIIQRLPDLCEPGMRY